MGLRANFDRGFLRRYLLMAAVGLGWAAYCAYDGLVAYPKKLEIAREFDVLRKLEADREIDYLEREKRWKSITDEKQWPSQEPKKTAEEMRNLISQQYFMGAIGLLIGLPALYSWFTSRNSWIERTPTGLTTSWGQKLDYTTVQILNKRRWTKKGIAVAEYEDGGTRRKFVFDDFKFERQPLDQMLRDLEMVLSDAQIVEGRREPLPGASSEESSADGNDSGGNEPGRE